jgi:lipopolysaccharide/colanic/teichoic acid biosynthesis glycosyltransferase
MGKRAALARHFFYGTKRLADIVLGGLALLICLPILAIGAIIIKLSSPGPILYRQIRIGKHGNLFTMLKLRTMYVDAEASTGPVWASRNDPRIVPTCRWMRRSHVDELPQLINVIRGEMSLVGPRPERPEIVSRLRQYYPDIERRLAVTPGITGLAQIRNGYDKTVDSARRKLDADIEYIRTCTWSVDLLILASTLTKLYDRAAH